MSRLQALVDADIDYWSTSYRRAVAAGSGRVLERSEERIAACDELTVLAICALADAHTWAPLAHLARDPQYEHTLAGHAASAIRLLDSALAAHGRDNGYSVDVWRHAPAPGASASADLYGHLPTRQWPLVAAVQDATACAARTLLALPRDRLAVPEALTDALGPLIAVYAATAPSTTSW